MPGKEAGASAGTDVPKADGSVGRSSGDVVGVRVPRDAIDVTDVSTESADRGG